MTRHVNNGVELDRLTLSELADLMAKIAETSADDPEIAHSEADDILIAAVMRMGTEGERIAMHFEDVDRWYA